MPWYNACPSNKDVTPGGAGAREAYLVWLAVGDTCVSFPRSSRRYAFVAQSRRDAMLAPHDVDTTHGEPTDGQSSRGPGRCRAGQGGAGPGGAGLDGAIITTCNPQFRRSNVPCDLKKKKSSKIKNYQICRNFFKKYLYGAVVEIRYKKAAYLRGHPPGSLF